ncbi:MAG: serine hydrolase [Desulfarculaceae bacterium]|nr:serine hydrolase [Desulfarculaceae bacterium]
MDAVSERMKKGIEQGVFPGGVLLVQEARRTRFFEAFGVSDIGSGQPVKKNSLFDLASLTKPLATALAFAKLVAEGKVRTGQTLSSLINAFSRTDKAGVTVEQLLRHKSGLPAHRPYYEHLVFHPRREREKVLREFLAAEPLVNRPGKTCLYSDIGYMILAWIVEDVSGVRLDRYVENEIYKPLGIRDLFFADRFASRIDGGAFQKTHDRMVSTENCRWREKVLRGEVHDDNAWAVGGVAGHAGLFGSADAVLKLAEEILGALQERRTTVLDGRVIRKFAEKKGSFSHVAGFDTPSIAGSAAGKYASSSTVGHLGFTGTSFWIDPVSSVIVILLTNRVHPLRENNAIRFFRPQLHDLVMERVLGKTGKNIKDCK